MKDIKEFRARFRKRCHIVDNKQKGPGGTQQKFVNARYKLLLESSCYEHVKFSRVSLFKVHNDISIYFIDPT